MTTTKTRTSGNLILETRIEFGSAARHNRGRFSGEKTHRLISEYIVGVVDEMKAEPGTISARFLKGHRELDGKGGFHIVRQPVLFSCFPACGCTQGQLAGKPSQGRTEADVTCDKCGK